MVDIKSMGIDHKHVLKEMEGSLLKTWARNTF